jgi:UPF0716 protein FxsA
LLTFLLIAFVAVPILEIAAFIKVGSLIGLWPTLGLTVATAIAGAALVRYQGLRTVMDLKGNLDSGRLPVEPAIHAGFLLVAGLCLLTPGFVTDTIGFVLLVPPARLAIARWLWRYVNRHGDVTVVVGQNRHDDAPGRRDGPMIELEAEDVSDDDRPAPDAPATSSPWRKDDGPTR